MTRVRNLTEVFPEKKDLADAIAMLKVVPEDIGEWDTTDASTSKIVFNAFNWERKGILRNGEDHWMDFDEHPREYGILKTLKEEGYIGEYPGGFANNHLYTLQRKS